MRVFFLHDLSSSLSLFRNSLFDVKYYGNVVGGESILFTPFVYRDMLDMIIWPRLGAVAERFWSKNNNEKDFYKRISHLSNILHYSGVQHKYQKHSKVAFFVDKYFLNSDPLFKTKLSQELCIFASAFSPKSRESLLSSSSINEKFDDFIDLIEPESYPFITFSSLVENLVKEGRRKWWLKKKDPRVKWVINMINYWKDSADYLLNIFEKEDPLKKYLPVLDAVIKITDASLKLFESYPELKKNGPLLYSFENTPIDFAYPIFVEPMIKILREVQN